MKQIKGVISALPTPFLNNQVDYGSLKKLVEYQLKNGINGFVVNGTTAESPTLDADEVNKIYKTVREISGSQVPIILGTGSNSTEDTKQNTIKAQEMGADAALVVVPYYNKPPQRGLVQHFTAVAEAAPSLPIILYNVPGRTITSMTAETIQALTSVKNITTIKEASGDLAFDETLAKTLPKSFTLLSGDDPTYIPFLKLGGSGVISVMSNVITAACAKWTQLCADQKYTEAQNDFEAYKTLINLMYVEANPIPVKWMLHKMGIFTSPELRLPLVSLDSKHFESITAEMKKVGLV